MELAWEIRRNSVPKVQDSPGPWPLIHAYRSLPPFAIGAVAATRAADGSRRLKKPRNARARAPFARDGDGRARFGAMFAWTQTHACALPCDSSTSPARWIAGDRTGIYPWKRVPVEHGAKTRVAKSRLLICFRGGRVSRCLNSIAP